MPSDIENIKGQKHNTLEAEKLRLKKATKEFESMVMYEMLKTMRKTIPKNDMTKESAGLSGGLGKDIFTEMFDMQLARKVTDGGSQSVSNILYKQVVKTLEARYKKENPDGVTNLLNSNNVAKDHMPLKEKNFIEQPNRFKEIDKSKNSKNFHQLEKSNISRSNSTNRDPILRKYGKIINEAALLTNLDPALIASVIKAESNGNKNAVSPAGAKGLMQLIDTTASDMNVKNVFKAKDNIVGGSKYLKKMLDRFGELKLALAAYNAGPENVKKYGDIPPFAETKAYIGRVMKNIAEYKNVNNNEVEMWCEY